MKIHPAARLAILACLASVSRLEAACCGACGAAAAPTNTTVVALNAAEKRHLLLMQDEEKLARDVYNAFAEKWKLRPFENIGTRSEPAHMEAVTALLQRHNAERTPQPAGAGEFRSPRMKILYNNMIKTGSASAVEALKVAVEIEELDIKDLREGAAKSNHAELKAVYANLEAASIRHLQAFMRNLKARDGEYTPKHLDVKTFNELASGENACEDDCAPAPAKGGAPGAGAAGQGAGPGRGPGPCGG